MSPYLSLPFIKPIPLNSKLPSQLRWWFAALFQHSDGFAFEFFGIRFPLPHWTPPGGIVPFLSVHEKRGSSTHPSLVNGIDFSISSTTSGLPGFMVTAAIIFCLISFY